jgi:hypothetical protein
MGANMKKKVTSRVLKTDPFIERRFSDCPRNSHHRRLADQLPKNVRLSIEINRSTYQLSAQKIHASSTPRPAGSSLDCYL